MGRIGGDVDGFTSAYGGLHSAKGRIHLAVEKDEGLLEVVTMWRRAAAGRDVHVDETEAACCILS